MENPSILSRTACWFLVSTLYTVLYGVCTQRDAGCPANSVQACSTSFDAAGPRCDRPKIPSCQFAYRYSIRWAGAARSVRPVVRVQQRVRSRSPLLLKHRSSGCFDHVRENCRPTRSHRLESCANSPHYWRQKYYSKDAEECEKALAWFGSQFIVKGMPQADVERWLGRGWPALGPGRTSCYSSAPNCDQSLDVGIIVFYIKRGHEYEVEWVRLIRELSEGCWTDEDAQPEAIRRILDVFHKFEQDFLEGTDK